MAKGKTDARTPIGLKCTKCGYMIRHTEKNTKNTTDKLELNKYCKFCRKTTKHKETKK